ncbi:MAG: DUF1848 domain-containing protein [Lachnospiraceae bacterium]|nr:DUF1848 domain-containing protein [Lachnospiraceae bacterium]
MILNTGCRTDIPAYYSEWFYNRISEGYVLTRNPYYPNQVMKYRLNTEVVDCLCFCTKNPEPMLPRMREMEQFGQFWQVTITPYGKEIEPDVPDKAIVMEAFKRLSGIVGLNAIGWRYDPIFLTEQYSLDFHLETFDKMAGNLSSYTKTCVISFIDLYAKTRRNFPGIREVSQNDQIALAKGFVEIGRKYGMAIRSCGEGTFLSEYGVDVSGCMTKQVIEHAIGEALDQLKLKTPAREECRCLLGNDIGMYNTCGHGCLYCYANYDRKTVEQNMRLHNPNSPLLIGELSEDDVIKETKQVSFCSGQMTLPW